MFSKKYIQYAVLAVLALGVCAFVNSSGRFPDPDSFYHAGMVDLIADRGLPRELPWLQFTELKTRFVDHHLLYHLLLVPLIRWFGSLEAIYLAAIFFAAGSVIAFFHIQKRKGITLAPLGTLLLLASSTFLLRVNLGKGVAPALIVFFLLIFAIFENKKSPAFILSAIYPWLYAGWPVVLVVLFAVAAGAYLLPGRGSRVKSLLEKERIITLMAAFAGLCVGVVTNPYFPNNIWFTWLQAIKIGVFYYQSKIPVGLEWYPYGFGELFSIIALPFLFFVLALMALFYSLFKNNEKVLPPLIGERAREAMSLSILMAVFFVLTLKSKRSAEYFIPLFLLTSAWCADIAIRLRPDIGVEIIAFIKSKMLITGAAIYLSAASLFIAGRDVLATKKYFDQGFGRNTYEGAAKALKDELAPGDLVFNADWDDFPFLFYWNKEQYYVAGLDPTFFYQYDLNLYSLWRQASLGAYRGDLHNLIANRFGAKAVFLDKAHKKFDMALEADQGFKLLYEDAGTRIYGVK